MFLDPVITLMIFINKNWRAIPFIKREEEETNMMERKTFEGLRNIRQLKI
jgi:hypothetical protein